MQRRWMYDGYEQRVSDMHALKIATDSVYCRGGVWSGTWAGQEDYSATSSCGTVRAIFRDLEAVLIAEIERADYVYGCVAWLTSEPILRALAQKQGVQIVVQKEDFLRPDLEARSSWARSLRAMYDALKNPIDRYGVSGRTHFMSSCRDPSIDAVRCVGNHNLSKQPAFPRAHHKFVLFGNLVKEEGDDYQPYVRPYAVWTGSFNFTKNAGRSFENAVILTDPFIVAAYEHEWSQILALSEPLDWETVWAAPEWRIGT